MAAAQQLSLAVRACLLLYGLAWRAAMPGLRRNKRLAEGWDKRLFKSGWLPEADLWVQAASGGEAYLAWELLYRLPDVLAERGQPLPEGRPLRVLVTTFTSQGLGVLERAAEALTAFGVPVELTAAFVPFDLPGIMRRALARVSPRAVVLLETEIWPGLLAACRERGVPVVIVNGRMTPKSAGGYSWLPWLWRALAPDRVLAVSEADARRFAAVYGDGTVGRMANIKFDRLDFVRDPNVQGGVQGGAQGGAEGPAALLDQADGSRPPFLVLGSVRREEEPDALKIILGLRQRVPGAVIGLFPRHMQRMEAWRKLLADAGVPCALRSSLANGAGPAAPGSVVLWDVFGELAGAFALARTCFLGGSLADLGGQNFLEPLAHGVVPVIGPSWSNFAWVGEEIFQTGLVRRAEDWRGVLDALCALAADPPDRNDVRARAEAYAAPRRGGAAAACQAVAPYLISG